MQREENGGWRTEKRIVKKDHNPRPLYCVKRHPDVRNDQTNRIKKYQTYVSVVDLSASSDIKISIE